VSGANEARSERVVDRRETTVARPERLGAFEEDTVSPAYLNTTSIAQPHPIPD